MNASKTKYAVVAGISLILMAAAASFSYGYVHGSLIVLTDPATTLQNLKASVPTFVAGVGGWLVIFLTDIIVAWALYRYLERVNRRAAATMAWLRVLYAVVLAVAIYQLIFAASIIPDSLDANLVASYLQAFESIWSAGLIIFGAHLVVLGYVTTRSLFVPRFFGWLLVFAGVCYAGVHTAKALAPTHLIQIQRVEMALSLPMAMAEIGLAFWLIFFSGRAEKRGT